MQWGVQVNVGVFLACGRHDSVYNFLCAWMGPPPLAEGTPVVPLSWLSKHPCMLSYDRIRELLIALRDLTARGSMDRMVQHHLPRDCVIVTLAASTSQVKLDMVEHRCRLCRYLPALQRASSVRSPRPGSE